MKCILKFVGTEYVVEEIEKYNYLGVIVTREGEVNKEKVKY